MRSSTAGYLARVVEREFLDQGYAVRRPATLGRWTTAYAATTATTTSFEKIREAAARGDGEPAAKATAITYRDVLERLWLVEPVHGWLPTRNQLGRFTQVPRHHLADPALAARLLGVDDRALLGGATSPLHADGPLAAAPRDGTLFGQLFESLVTQSVRVYAQAAEARVHHMRQRDGRHEVDLIVERADQRVVAIEVKLSATVDGADVRHLRWLAAHLGDDLLDAAVVCTGPFAYRRPDRIAVIPAALLGA